MIEINQSNSIGENDLELYIIRHGESIGNKHPDQDMPDSALTILGELQASQVASALLKAGITHIFSSPLIRALQTAQPLASVLDMTITVCKDISEYRTGGSYIGPKRNDLKKQFPEAEFSLDIEEDGWTYAGNDNPELAMQKAVNMINQFKKYDKGSKIAIFSHGAFNQYLIKAALDLSNADKIGIYQKNACINWLIINENDKRINKICDTGHLTS